MTTVPLTYRAEKSHEHSHIEWLELHGDGVLHECAIMREDSTGSKLFLKVNDLDEIDRRRLAGILGDRNARRTELWDLMAQRTLGNGINSLVYFHQLVKMITPNGKILDLKSGQAGFVAPTGTINTATK